jgi:hypothetical protein
LCPVFFSRDDSPVLYEFLRDERELESFVASVLPDTTVDECFLLMLCARRKYLTEEEKTQLMLGESATLRREIIGDRGKLLRKVKELCVPSGLYQDRNGCLIPPHAFAVYVTPNPRSSKKAAVRLIAALAEGLAEGKPLRLESLVKTQIHRAVSRKIYLDLDVDPADDDDWQAVVDKVRAILGQTPLHVIQTRTGAHVLVPTHQLDPSVKRIFYQRLRELGRGMEGLLEIRGDAMVPVPGTSQGGATARLLRSSASAGASPSEGMLP